MNIIIGIIIFIIILIVIRNKSRQRQRSDVMNSIGDIASDPDILDAKVEKWIKRKTDLW